MTDSVGNNPTAVSAESITASAPSNTAVATSDASALFGEGEAIIDSSIWVATITGFPACLHSSIMSFCIPGTFSGGNSTPKSPRATIIPSQAPIILFNSLSADGFSIFAITPALSPIYFLTSSTSLNF